MSPYPTPLPLDPVKPVRSQRIAALVAEIAALDQRIAQAAASSTRAAEILTGLRNRLEAQLQAERSPAG